MELSHHIDLADETRDDDSAHPRRGPRGAATPAAPAIIYGPRLACTGPGADGRDMPYSQIVLDADILCQFPSGSDAEPTTPAPAPAVEAEPIRVSRSQAATLLVDTGSAEWNTTSLGYQLVNMPVILWTTAREHTTSTELLGTEVFVRFTPVEHSWDPNDGSPSIITTDPGAPYPDHTVSHSYVQPAAEMHVSVTTTWAAEYHVAGTTDWTAIDGTIPITTDTETFQIRERRVRLVPDCSAPGSCIYDEEP